MSDAPEVDFSQIRGDWHFHLNYLANAVKQSLVRTQKMWGEVQSEAQSDAIGALVEKLVDAWTRLEATATEQDPIDIASPILDEFMELCAQSKPLCDSLEEAKGLAGASASTDSPLEQFTEAMRQSRSFNEDLVMMREQKP